jgi:thiamine-monophosphate kinase
MRLSRLGEFGLIRRIRERVRGTGRGVVLGIGDDTAVLRVRKGWEILLTTDALVEETHFRLKYTPMESLGWKALAINISDVAAMGGIPRACTVSLALPEQWRVEDVDRFYEGLNRCARAYGCEVVGGDTVGSSGPCFISVTLLGEVEAGRAFRRGGAREGDLIFVTGSLGGARSGLEVLETGSDTEEFSDSVSRFLEPKPRLEEARGLMRCQGVHAMIDISDGLASELGHLCESGSVGCLIEERKIPVLDEAEIWCRRCKKDPISFVLGSGEEYQLLFTVESRAYEEQKAHPLLREGGVSTVIGRITEGSKRILISREGRHRRLESEGWDHFGS